ncbi:MAG TPA: hypothetical protein VGE07_24955 [Herpetosiphonaceae bacterium]
MSYLLPLGPFQHIWRGPLRIVLRVDGERISDVDCRDGYAARGVADRLARSSLPQALHLASHVCAIDSQAHTLAFVQALESLAGIKIEPRAAFLRVIASEVERGIAHFDAFITIYQILGLQRDADYLQRLKHGLVEVQQNVCGAPMQPNYHLPGGVRQDISASVRESTLIHLRRLERLMYRFVDRFIDHRGILRRTVGNGVLTREAGEQFGVRGPLARAAGITYDARLDKPYAAYPTLQPQRVTQERGDVYSRLVVLALEAFESIKLTIRALSDLPESEWMGNSLEHVAEGTATATVESARGTLRYTVQSNGVKLTSVRIDAPRQFDRLLSRTLLAGMAVDDAALILASTAPCIACAEQ